MTNEELLVVGCCDEKDVHLPTACEDSDSVSSNWQLLDSVHSWFRGSNSGEKSRLGLAVFPTYQPQL